MQVEASEQRSKEQRWRNARIKLLFSACERPKEQTRLVLQLPRALNFLFAQLAGVQLTCGGKSRV